MRKFIALTLAITMCLSFVACGGDPTAPSTAENSTTQQPTTTPSKLTYGATGSKFANHTYLKDIYGNWIFEKDWYGGKYNLYRTLEINEDGSCKIDGTDANWRLEDEVTSSTYLYIGIYSNSELIYAACFITDLNYGFCMIPLRELVSKPDGAVFLKE